MSWSVSEMLLTTRCPLSNTHTRTWLNQWSHSSENAQIKWSVDSIFHWVHKKFEIESRLPSEHWGHNNFLRSLQLKWCNSTLSEDDVIYSIRNRSDVDVSYEEIETTWSCLLAAHTSTQRIPNKMVLAMVRSSPYSMRWMAQKKNTENVLSSCVVLVSAPKTICFVRCKSNFSLQQLPPQEFTYFMCANCRRKHCNGLGHLIFILGSSHFDSDTKLNKFVLRRCISISSEGNWFRHRMVNGQCRCGCSIL